MAGNIRDSNYYRQRTADIRARGGDERYARAMQNYADLYDAGIYNDNSAPVRFGNAPQPAQPVKKSSGSPRKQKVADAPSKYVGSEAIAQHFSQAPEYDADTYRTNYEPSPLGTADFKRLNDTNTIGVTGGYGNPPEDGVPVVQRGSVEPQDYDFDAYRSVESLRQGLPAAVAGLHESTKPSSSRESMNFGDIWRQAYTNTPVGDTREQDWQNAKNSISSKLQGFSRNILGRYLNPSTNSVADFKRLNDTNTIGVSDLLPQKDAYMDLPTYDLPPMEVTAEAPKDEDGSQKKFQLVGTKPGGGSALTKFYASQLRYVPYERNKGVNGIKYGSSGLVNRMRNLCQIIPYNETDGTNCARTVSAALDGTPYAGLYNVDQMIEIAARQGQLRAANGDYQPKAGDLAITNEGNHIVMVTENGGVIQNGQSRNGVYETKKKPQEQKGGAQFYITTSDYSDLFPSFHFGTGIADGYWNEQQPFSDK